MKDLGEVKKCSGFHVNRDKKKRTLCIDQQEYINSIIKNYNMENSESCPTPMEEGTNATLTKTEGCDENLPYRSLIGALMYLYQATCLDISFPINILSRFNNCYQQQHWKSAKRVVKYLKGTTNYKLCFGPNNIITVRRR